MTPMRESPRLPDDAPATGRGRAAGSAPLQGIVIVDLSRILAGPFAAQLLADLGAEVSKVESPAGDPTRRWGPPFAGDDPTAGDSAYFRCANRGKRTVEIDLDQTGGRARLDALLDDADVLVENFRPASAKRLGLRPDELRARFPRLVVASIRSFASDTEARDRPGYDFLAQAEAGWMSVTGEPDGRPAKVGIALVDVLAGLYLANGIQAALAHRARTGVALHVEVPLMEAALAGLVNVGSGVLMTGRSPRRFGNGHPNIVPYQTFRVADGEVAIAVGNDRQFADLMRALDLDATFAAEPGWCTNPGRVVDRERVVQAIEAATMARTRSEILRICETAQVAAGPVRTVDEALLGPEGQLHRAVVVHDPNELGETIRTIGTPILLDGRRAQAQAPPPGPPRPPRLADAAEAKEG